MVPKRVLYYGIDEPLPEKVRVAAGGLSAIFESGDLRWISVGGVEAIRRVYVALRDRNWGTVPGALSKLHIERGQRSFRISYEVEHRQRDIHFRWTGRITGSEDSTILFEFEGKALTAFLRNRIGFCVLHPMEGAAGRPCTVEKIDGTVVQGEFPRLIAPHQPFTDIRAISHEVVPEFAVEARFSGETFEMEDQRNWTDASYKTYCTPLRLPFPAEIRAGTEMKQSVRISLLRLGKRGAYQRESFSDSDVRFDSAAARPLPAIGFCASARELDGRETALLKALKPAHVRCTPAQAQAAAKLGAPLEIELAIAGARFPEVNINAPVARWLVFHAAEKTTPAAWIGIARKHLKGSIVGGTNAYFTELNRARPDPALIDGACFSINPQVHAFDNDSLVENLAAQAAVVESAKAFLARKAVHVTPVTLRMRFNPDATEAAPQPPPPDPRQASLFGAGWTLGSIKYLAEAGASSITYYETAGPRGLMDERGVFPLYHVFADVADFAGGEVAPSRSLHPLEYDAIVLRKNNRARILLAGFSPELRSVRLSTAQLGRRVRIRHLDETNGERAMRDPMAFRAEPGSAVDISGHLLEIEMRPYAVVRIDSEG